jgi:hypothetical protein
MLDITKTVTLCMLATLFLMQAHAWRTLSRLCHSRDGQPRHMATPDVLRLEYRQVGMHAARRILVSMFRMLEV